jgi:mRNA-degrading endonuclease RelE of RelBE toxin-antitoxin system
MEHVFVEAEVFSQWRDDYFEDDDSFSRFQMFLNTHPTAGDVIAGCGGVRKIRWGGRGKGKRGGLRVIYLQIPEVRRIMLIHVYHKSEETDLDSETRREIAALADEYRHTVRQEQPKGGR